MAAAKQLILDIIARDKTKQGLASATKNVSGMGKAARAVGSGIAAIGLAAFAKESIDTFQSATKETLALNRAVGGSVEASSRLRFAAKQTGQDLGNFTKAMGLLDKNLVKAAQTGKGPVSDTMKSLGVAFTDAQGKVKPLTEILPDMAEQFKNMPNGPTKTALALQLFGRQGTALLPFLNRGKAGISELMAKTDEYNQVIGQDQVDAFAKNLEAQRKFDAAMDGIKMTLGESLLPAITPIVEKLGDLAKFFGDLPQPVQTTAVAVAGAAVAFNLLSGPLGMVKSGLTGLSGLFTSAGTAATTASTGVSSVGTASAGAAGGISAGAASLGILAGVAATAFGALIGNKLSDSIGEVGAAATQLIVPGAGLGALFHHWSATSAEAELGMKAVRQAIGDMANSGDIDGLVTKWALMEQQMSPDELIAFANSTPQLNAALAKVGLRVDSVTGKIEAIPKAPNVKVSAETKAAVKKLEDARHKAVETDNTDPNIRVTTSIEGAIAALQSVINKAREAKTAASEAGGSGGGGSWATGGEASGVALVGERGPELVYLPQGSHVATASQTRGLLNGGAPRYAKGKASAKAKAKAKAKAAKNAAIDAKIKAKQAARQNAVDAQDVARSAQADAIANRDSLVSRVKDQTRSFFGIGGYDPNAQASAAAELQAAQAELNGTAVGSSARASAQARVKAAQDAAGSTPGSAADWVRQRIDKVRRWKTALGKLAAVWGGNPYGQQLLQDVMDKGPDGGTELAEQLLATPGELSSLVNSYAAGDSLGNDIANYNPDVVNANAQVSSATRQVEQLQTVILQLDGEILHQSLLKVRRRKGGQRLGLD